MSFKMNENHWNILIEFMENHVDFARGKFSGPTGKSNQRKLWEELAARLNSLGFGSRPVEKWQKSWADIKYSIKKKASLCQQQLKLTGGGPVEHKFLNDWEERVVAILGKTFHEGVGSVECGIPSDPQDTFTVADPTVPTQHLQKSCPITEPSTSSHQSLLEEIQINIDHNMVDDHNYSTYQSRVKKRKRQEDIENELYQETIKELRLIRQSVDNVSSALNGINGTLLEIKEMLMGNR